MTVSNFKKSVMTSCQWRHRNYVSEKRHKYFFIFWAPSIKISGYASVAPVDLTTRRLAHRYCSITDVKYT